MKKIQTLSLNEIYLDYVNNFLTIERFAEFYGIEINIAEELINISRTIYQS